MTPKRIDTCANSADLIQKVESWFHECSDIQKDQTRIGRVGEKLVIFYRLSFIKNGEPRTAEQQVYCRLRDGRIDGLSLLGSGFEPTLDRIEAPAFQTANDATDGQTENPPAAQRGGIRGSGCGGFADH
jgi:hypothetical protein